MRPLAAPARAAMKFIRGEPRKPGDEAVRRAVVELERRADLLDHPAVQHHDAVGHGHRLGLVVGDVDHGGVELGVEPAELDPHLRAERGVEVGERLVEEEDLGRAGDGAADGDALLLAAGELLRALVEVLADAQDRGGARHRGVDLGLRPAGHLEREAHVLAHGHVRVERVVLEHHGDAAVRRLLAGHVAAVDGDACRR